MTAQQAEGGRDVAGPEPGWYQDPEHPDDPSRLRYWDGDGWTERHHRPPAGGAPPAPPPSSTAGASAAGGSSIAGLLSNAWVVGLLVVVLLAAAYVVLGPGFGGGGCPETRTANLAPETTDEVQAAAIDSRNDLEGVGGCYQARQDEDTTVEVRLHRAEVVDTITVEPDPPDDTLSFFPSDDAPEEPRTAVVYEVELSFERKGGGEAPPEDESLDLELYPSPFTYGASGGTVRLDSGTPDCDGSSSLPSAFGGVVVPFSEGGSAEVAVCFTAYVTIPDDAPVDEPLPFLRVGLDTAVFGGDTLGDFKVDAPDVAEPS